MYPNELIEGERDLFGRLTVGEYFCYGRYWFIKGHNSRGFLSGNKYQNWIFNSFDPVRRLQVKREEQDREFVD